MKKAILIGASTLLSLPLMLGSGPIVAENADLLRVQGEGEIELVNGTLLHKQYADGQWTALLSRNNGSLKIEVTAEDGTYIVETWSIAADPMNPQRVHQSMTVDVGDETNPGETYGLDQLYGLLHSWGCTGSCEYDYTGDGVVNAWDMLHLFSVWTE